MIPILVNQLTESLQGALIFFKYNKRIIIIVLSLTDEWNPMKDDFTSPTFNSYNKGVGAQLKPSSAVSSSQCNYTLFIDKIPISLTRVSTCITIATNNCCIVKIQCPYCNLYIG